MSSKITPAQAEVLRRPAGEHGQISRFHVNIKTLQILVDYGYLEKGAVLSRVEADKEIVRLVGSTRLALEKDRWKDALRHLLAADQADAQARTPAYRVTDAGREAGGAA